MLPAPRLAVPSSTDTNATFTTAATRSAGGTSSNSSRGRGRDGTSSIHRSSRRSRSRWQRSSSAKAGSWPAAALLIAGLLGLVLWQARLATRLPGGALDDDRADTRRSMAGSLPRSSALVSSRAVQRFWPPVLGAAMGRHQTPLPIDPGTLNCIEGFPGQKECFPYLIGLSCDECGGEVLARLLAHHPWLSYGNRPDHSFFSSEQVKLKELISDERVRASYAAQFVFSTDSAVLGFDWSVDYLSDAGGHVKDMPERVRALLPHARFVVVLRNPRDMEMLEWLLPLWSRRRAENVSALAGVECRYTRLAAWLAVFPRDQFLVVKYEDVVAKDPRVVARVLAEVAVFLGLEPVKISAGETWQEAQPRVNARSKEELNKQLVASFEDGAVADFTAACARSVHDLLGKELWPEHKAHSRAGDAKIEQALHNASTLLVHDGGFAGRVPPPPKPQARPVLPEAWLKEQHRQHQKQHQSQRPQQSPATLQQGRPDSHKPGQSSAGTRPAKHPPAHHGSSHHGISTTKRLRRSHV